MQVYVLAYISNYPLEIVQCKYDKVTESLSVAGVIKDCLAHSTCIQAASLS